MRIKSCKITYEATGCAAFDVVFEHAFPKAEHPCLMTLSHLLDEDLVDGRFDFLSDWTLTETGGHDEYSEDILKGRCIAAQITEIDDAEDEWLVRIEAVVECDSITFESELEVIRTEDDGLSRADLKTLIEREIKGDLELSQVRGWCALEVVQELKITSKGQWITE